MDQRDLLAIVEEELASGNFSAYTLARRIEEAQRTYDSELLRTLGYPELADLVMNI